VFAKISEEFASYNGSQSLIGRSRTLNEAREVGRADHVEIDIERDVTTHLLGQGSHVVAGADEAALLCAPECEAHATAGLRRPPGQPQRRFEHYSRAATIVVDARPLRHAVEMRTNNDEGATAVKGRVGQYVSSQPLSDHGVDLEAHSGAAASCDIERAAEFV
jgi:hypothetical protein